MKQIDSLVGVSVDILLPRESCAPKRPLDKRKFAYIFMDSLFLAFSLSWLLNHSTSQFTFDILNKNDRKNIFSICIVIREVRRPTWEERNTRVEWSRNMYPQPKNHTRTMFSFRLTKFVSKQVKVTRDRSLLESILI